MSRSYCLLAYVLYNRRQDFSFDGKIDYYESGSGANYLTIIDSGRITPDVFANTKSVLISVSTLNVFHKNEDYTSAKSVLKIIGAKAWTSEDTEVIATCVR